MLKRSADRKVTNGVSPNGKTAAIANSFGLPSGKAFSCPGATSVCEKVCYAGKLETLFPGVRANLTHNWDMLKDATIPEMVRLLTLMVEEFKSDCDLFDTKAIRKAMRNKTDSPDPVKRVFRIHWDGDFFSLDYAKAWRKVIESNTSVTFWVYTRSFTDALDVLPVFDDMSRDNMSLYLSVDSANLTAAKAARKAYPWALWAYLAPTFADGRDDLAGFDGKRYDCPEIKGSVPMIDKKGSACVRCNICVKGRGDVIFSISKRKA